MGPRVSPERMKKGQLVQGWGPRAGETPGAETLMVARVSGIRLDNRQLKVGCVKKRCAKATINLKRIKRDQQ